MSAPTDEFEYLCVEGFINTLLDARGLKTALEVGLIDRLQENESNTFDDLLSGFPGDTPGLRLLLDLLAANQVVVRSAETLRLSDRFRVALRYRDLLEAKLDFAELVAPDVVGLFTLLIADPGEFMRRARLFQLFDYRNCLEASAENIARARRWMRFTTALTRYEAEVCLDRHDFGPYRNWLDVGGNSGEFVLRGCKRHARLTGTVADLPVVCEIGRQHVFAEPEAERIRFHPGDALRDPLPPGFDLVTFKSVLHDWPEVDAGRLLARAVDCLAPGGTLLIFEREPLQTDTRTMTYGMLPMLLFFRAFRAPTRYAQQLASLGLVNISTESVPLETPFMLLTAHKPAAGTQHHK